MKRIGHTRVVTSRSRFALDYYAGWQSLKHAAGKRFGAGAA
jgi:hypothetical protein